MYKPNSISEDLEYYHASRYAEDKYVYVLLNKKGEVVTSEFDDSITNYGEIIHCGDGIYNFKKEKIVDGVYSGVNYDSSFTKTYSFYNLPDFDYAYDREEFIAFAYPTTITLYIQLP
jgi:hypothetical protein